MNCPRFWRVVDWIRNRCTRSPPVWAMQVEVNLHNAVVALGRVQDQIDNMLALVQAGQQREESQMSAMGDAVAKLQADVAAETTVNQSAITLLNGIPQLIKDAAGDPSALNDLAATIEANTAGLASAVTANTPAAPTP